MIEVNARDASKAEEDKTSKSALCFLTRRPNGCLVNIAQQVHEQVSALSDNVYVMIDDDTYELNDKDVACSNIQFLKIDKETCVRQGFKNCSLICTNKYLLKEAGLPSVDTLVIAWDKAIFYFTRINTKYDFVWFIEDDVFIPSVECIRLLNDECVASCDLVCADNIVNATGEFNPNWSRYDPSCPVFNENGEFGSNWWWYDMPRLRFSLPWHGSLVCIMGASRRLLAEVDMFVKDRGELGFIEFMFSTLAAHAHLRICNPSTLKTTIHWAHPWTLNDVLREPRNLFHPCKELDTHDDWRNKLKETAG